MTVEIQGPSEQVKSYPHSHSAITTAKTPVLINSLPVIPLNSVAANAENEYAYDSELTKVDKAASEAWVVGDKVYWDDTAKDLTKTSTGNTLTGYVVRAAASADTTGYIHWNPLFA